MKRITLAGYEAILTFILAINSLFMQAQFNTVYRVVKVNGLSIFYREAGSTDAPTILFLHGFPSSSRMFESLFPLLAAQYHLVAPDYPGFGHSDAPDPAQFAYTFDHLASIVGAFTETIGLKEYTLYMQDYGGPIGFRLAIAHPETVQGMIIQNAVTHMEGLSPLWDVRQAYWRDRGTYEDQLRANFTSLEATKQRHIGTSPHPEWINPDTWTDEYAFLTRPGETQIQLDLFYDYQTNVASYLSWQQWLRDHQPRLLVVWGKYDPSFTIAGAEAYKRDVPDAQVVLLDAGHFALDEASSQIGALILAFPGNQNPAVSQSLPNTSFGSVHPENIQWIPYAAGGNGASTAYVVGLPSSPGPYVIRVKAAAGLKLMPHVHPEDRVYTVISGVFYIGLGKTFDSTKLVAYGPGSVVVLPHGTSHFHWAKSGEYVTQIYGIGPFGTTYVNPVEDPRYKK